MVALGLVLFGRDLLGLMFGGAFTAADLPMLIFAGNGVVTVPRHPVRPLPASLGKVYVTFWSRILNMLVRAIAFWHGPPTLGADRRHPG